MASLFEKISIEEVIDETEIDTLDYWVKYTASLCKTCGAEPGEHNCKTNYQMID